MSQHSFLNIQEISSRTFQNDSVMERSIEPQDHHNTSIVTHMLKPVNRHLETSSGEMIRRQQQEFSRLRNEVMQNVNHVRNNQRAEDISQYYEGEMNKLMDLLNKMHQESQEIQQNYHNAIKDLKQTLQKNTILHSQVDRLKKKVLKLEEAELNYSRDQNYISNLSKQKSQYEIELVNMKDSLLILDKEKKQIEETNEQYEQKLALLSQQIERLRGQIDPLRQENQKLRIASNEFQSHIKRQQMEFLEIKPSVERLRNQNRELRGSNTNLTKQLQEYHEKLLFKEREVNDLQEKQHKTQMVIRTKESQIQELQLRTETLLKSTRNIEEQSEFRDNNIKQQLGRMKASLNQNYLEKNKLEQEKMQLNRQYSEHKIRFQMLKKQFDVVDQQKEATIRDIERIIIDRDNLHQEKQFLEREREKILFQNEQVKQTLKKSQQQLKQFNLEKSRQLQNTIRHFEQNSKDQRKDYEVRIQRMGEEINAKNNEISKYKIEINSYKNALQNYKMEVHQLKQSTISQSTIIDTHRKDFDEKLREKNEEIGKLEDYIQNLEVDYRRQIDEIKMSKSRFLEKERNYSVEFDQLSKQIALKDNQIEHYRQILSKNEQNFNQLNINVREADSRVVNLTNQLERIASILRDKQAHIAQLNAKNRQILAAFEQKKNEVENLKQINDKMNSNLSKAEQTKGNFKVFMSEIQRLNEVVTSKESQIKNQRLQIAKLIQKIDLVYQEQMKIIKIIENTYADDAKRDVEMNNQMADLREYIGKLSQSTNFTLQDIFQQGGNIINYLTKNQSDLRYKIQDQTNHYQTLIARKDQQILSLKEQIDNYRLKIKEKDQSEEKQEEIFQKLVELTRQNAAIKEQLEMNSSQYENEINGKQQSIIQLESKVRQIQKLQKKEVQSLKEYISQREQNDSEVFEENKRLRQELDHKQRQIQKNASEKDRIIEQLNYQNRNLESKLQKLPRQIDSRLLQIKRLSEQISPSKQIQKYKQKVKKYEEELQRYHSQQFDESRLRSQEKQIQKLEKIVEIRNIQIQNNEQSYLKLKNKQEETERQLANFKNIVNQLRSYQTHSTDLQYQLRQLEEQKDKSSLHYRQVADLKDKNLQLQRDLRILQNKLKDSEHKLFTSNQEISKHKHELQKLLEFRTKSINKIEYFESSSSQKHQLQQKIHDLEDELQLTIGQLKEVQIDYDYLKSNQDQSRLHLNAYEHKTLQVERQYLKLKEVLNNLNNENSKLNTKNYYFELELKKADILQQKIQVLNGQINRLSYENINLCEEVTSCKLALGGESAIERKTEEQLSLIVLLFAQIQSLRSRLKDSEHELQTSRYQHLSRFRY